MENVRKVLVVGPMPSAATDLFEAREDIVYEVVTDVTEENLLEKVQGVHGMTVRTALITPTIIAAAESLEIVSRYGVGYDNIEVPSLNKRGIPLAVVGTANSDPVAEAAMFMMFELAKMGRQHDKAVREGNWNYRLETNAIELWKKKLLIVGFGRIGTRLARRCKALEMEISVADPYVSPEVIIAAGCTPVGDFHKVLPDMDYVSLHLPLSPESEGMIGPAEFEAMKPTAILINCARGGIVDEVALYAALSSGQIRGAGLDVFDAEPPRKDNPLFHLDNIVFSPHIAGVTREAAHRMAVVCAQNVLDRLDGKLDRAMVVNTEVMGPA
jgi:D-3-phosphoglycerate dehydrogenase